MKLAVVLAVGQAVGIPRRAEMGCLIHQCHIKSWKVSPPMTEHLHFLPVVAETLKFKLIGAGYGGFSYHQIHFPDPNKLDRMLLTTGFFCLAFGSSVPPVLVL